jgi:hypothetical protein
MPNPTEPDEKSYENAPPDPEARPDEPESEAELDKELADSFPNSDPPSSWAGAD